MRPNHSVFTSLVNVCVQGQNLRCALKALQEMLSAGEPPETIIFNSLIELCGNVGQLKYAMQMYEYMKQARA